MTFKYLLLFFSFFTLLLSKESYQVVEDFQEQTYTDSNKITTQNITTIPIKNIEQETKVVIKNLQKSTKTQKPKAKNTKKESNKTKAIKHKVTHKNSKAKLVIIIDDISHRYQLNEIKNLGLKITPSIFPPNRMNMKNHLLAKGLKHYMVHLPLQSDSKQMNKMHKTIFISYSKKQIENRVKEVRRLFPTAKYLNNHTGSKFSANYNASKKLYKALIDNGFIFVDSRTSDHTKFPKIAKEFNKRYLKADFFIDNRLNTNYIVHQINRGIALAKRRGYAVIIGHPHLQTFKALKRLKYKLKSINLIYIDEL